MARPEQRHPDTLAGGRRPAAVIMAAGKGTRMESDLPKVVHAVAGRPMVCHVVEACLEAGCDRVVAIVGYKQELVREALASFGDRVRFAVQAEQLGTGHAVRCAEGELAGLDAGTPVLVLAGDGPLIRAGTLRRLLDRHAATGASATLATSVIEDPAGYGRIVRDGSGGFLAIVEHKNATEAQRSIREVNPSYYCFRLGSLWEGLGRVGRDGASGEYYLTDVPAILLAGGERVEVIDAVPPEDVLSINTLAQLAEVDRIMRARLSGAQGGT
ncbi:MAG: NTP transferase domain-containing protein [Phycisphaerales bacterium]|nr:NTP transferase domain-containing protein [Phycisphaerales bacterium]